MNDLRWVLPLLILVGCDGGDDLDGGRDDVDAGERVDAGPRGDDGGVVADDAGPGTDASIPLSPGLVLFDDFEYAVDRDTMGAADAFRAHGWAGAKTIQDGSNGARGHVYTSDTVPGWTDPLPGRGSSRVLVLEALPQSLVGQTDFYVQFGDGDGPVGQIPPNHWVQFWIYAPSGPNENVFTQGKFLYYNRADFYPATLSNGGYVYLTTLGKSSGASRAIDCDPRREVPCSNAFFRTIWNSEAGLTNRQIDAGHILDQNLVDTAPVVPGAWTLVRMHVDISGTDARAAPGQAVIEQWIRRLGDAEWTKTTEWIGGATVNPVGDSSEPVDLTPVYTDGFRMMRMPTTVGGTNASIGDWYDYLLYVDDFAIAGAEDDLPVYP